MAAAGAGCGWVVRGLVLVRRLGAMVIRLSKSSHALGNPTMRLPWRLQGQRGIGVGGGEEEEGFPLDATSMDLAESR